MIKNSVLLLVAVCCLVGYSAYSQNAKFEWVDHSASSGSDLNYDMCIDNQDFIYTVGTFNSTVDLEPGPGVTSFTSNGNFDCYIRKMDPNKNFIWGLTFGGTLEDRIWGVETDNNGNVICVGGFRGTVDFDPGIGVFNMVAAHGIDFFILKLDSNGNFLWAKSFGKSPSPMFLSFDIDSQNDIILGGYFADSIDLDPSANNYSLYTSGPGIIDAFIAKYTGNGDFLWGKSIVSSLASAVQDIEVGSNDTIYISGYFTGNADLDVGIGVQLLSTQPGDDNGFLLKLTPSGGFVWAKDIGGDNDTNIKAIAIGTNNTAYLTGTFRGTVDFDPGPGTNFLTSYVNGPISSEHIFVAKWDSNGIPIWTKQFGTLSYEAASDIAVDILGNVYTCGRIDYFIDFDPSPNDDFWIYPGGDFNFYVHKFNANGDFSFAKLIKESVFESVAEIEFDSNESLFFAGSVNGTTDMDPGYLTNNITSLANDYFLLKLSPCTPSATTDTVFACSTPYQWIDGKLYYANNTSAKYVLEAANGCDSIVSLNLTIGSSNSATDVVSACNSFTWINGTTYTTSNFSATHTLTNVSGCDSTVTLNLTLTQNDSVVDVVQSCGPYTWIDGNTYASSNNTAQLVYTNTNGCDSIVQLNLTVGAPNSGTDAVSACDSYMWIDGNTYTSSTTSATHTLTNASGCDSVVTLNLSLSNSSSATDLITACDSYTWIDGSTYTSSNNAATHILSNSQGCDSTVTLNLTILNASSGNETVTACNEFTWINGSTYTNSTTANYMISGGAANGCDSSVTLNLTVIPVDTAVTNNDPQLVAAPGMFGYQWLDCANNFTPISGATTSIYYAPQNGEYAVEVEFNGCTDTSECYVINLASLAANSGSNWTISPNPTSQNVTVEFSEIPSNTFVVVTNPLGQTISTQEVNASSIELKLGAQSGIYFIRVISENGEEVVPIVKL